MRVTDRRTFFTQATAGAFGLGGAALTGAPPGPALPSVPLGDKRVTRLIAGGNPIAGFSHSTLRLSELMVRYFTVERTTEFLLHCEAEGINTFQSSYTPVVRDALRAVRERGSKIQYLCLSSDRPQISFQDILAVKPMAICHHGVDTDRLMRAGQQEKIRDYLRKVHDAGLPVGVSTHLPDNLARVEDGNWGNDFYMTCCYQVTRPAEDIKARMGDDVLGETYLTSDPVKMLARVRQIKKTCLAFKILAAGRLCGSKASIEKAFEFAYANIKPADAVIVGMFPILSDEVKEDSDLARKYGQAG